MARYEFGGVPPCTVNQSLVVDLVDKVYQRRGAFPSTRLIGEIVDPLSYDEVMRSGNSKVDPFALSDMGN